MQLYLKSKKWKEWVAKMYKRACKPCKDKNGTIYPLEKKVFPDKLHFFCRCFLRTMNVLTAGTATKKRKDGADWWLYHTGRLPDSYITKDKARSLGWIKEEGNLAQVAPGKIIGGDVYRNDDKKLPSSPNRIWYEADIDYHSGTRNSSRILYSNDGLIFITYTHYENFIELIGG